MESIELDVREVEFHNITVQKPRKTDDSLFGAVLYNNERLSLFVPNVEVVRHKKIEHVNKTYSVLAFKASSQVCKKFVLFDTQCTNQVKQHISQWFSKGLDENVIEEYYTSSISHGPDGVVIKLKIQSIDECLEKGLYDICLTLCGLRFYKQRFVAEWEINGYKPVEKDFINAIGTDDEDSWDKEDAPSPDSDVLKEMIKELETRIQEKKKQYENEMQSLQENLNRVDCLEKQLQNNFQSLSSLEEITEVLDTF